MLKGLLYLVAGFRLFSVYLGVFNLDLFKQGLYTLQNDQVTPLFGRTFATWTSLTCFMCIVCARNLNNKAIRQVTAFSFAAALTHFSFEYFLFGTLSFADYIRTAPIAGVSMTWLMLYKETEKKTK